jgi:hypothetical protein
VDAAVLQSPLLADGPPPAIPKGLPPEVEAMLDEIKAGKGPRELVHRVHELTGKLKTEQEAKAALEARLVEVERSQAQARPPAGPDAPEVARLKTEMAGIEKALVLASYNLRKNPDGGPLEGLDGQPILDARGQPVEMSPEEIIQEQVSLQRKLGELSSDARLVEARQRAQSEAVRARCTQDAGKLYPWYGKPESEEYKVASQILERFPDLKNMPEYPLVVGQLVTGNLAERKARASWLRKSTVPAAKPAPVVTRAAATAPKVNGAGSRLQGASDQFYKSGKSEDLAKVFAERRRMARATA